MSKVIGDDTPGVCRNGGCPRPATVRRFIFGFGYRALCHPCDEELASYGFIDRRGECGIVAPFIERRCAPVSESASTPPGPLLARLRSALTAFTAGT